VPPVTTAVWHATQTLCTFRLTMHGSESQQRWASFSLGYQMRHPCASTRQLESSPDAPWAGDHVTTLPSGESAGWVPSKTGFVTNSNLVLEAPTGIPVLFKQ